MGSIQVLSNDTNLTNEPLKVTIDESPTVGSATVNTDNSRTAGRALRLPRRHPLQIQGDQ